MPIRPGIVRIRTKLKSDVGRTTLANCITLTPGTLVVDITEEGDLYVHWIWVRSQDPEAAARLIASRFERILTRICP
jgi:multicomponent Na+:H+ antiporter subunit E